MTDLPIEQRAHPPDPLPADAGGAEPHGPVAEHHLRAARIQGRFPRPVSLGARAVGWIESELNEWIRERIEESRGESARATHKPEDQGEQE